VDVPELDCRRGGLATLAGQLVALAVLLRPLPSGLSAADTTQGIAFFAALPLVSLIGGAYAVLGGLYSGVDPFVAGSSLAVVSLTLGLGLGLAPAAVISTAGLGLSVFAVVAVLASLRAM
jgi:hypothetical protein